MLLGKVTSNVSQSSSSKLCGGFIQSHWLDWATATSEQYYLGTLLCVVEIRLTIQISVSYSRQAGFLAFYLRSEIIFQVIYYLHLDWTHEWA